MYYKEFHACFDWHHHGEALSPFLLQGLSDPDDPALQRRARRFAGMYMGDDPQAPNWDAEHRLVRSLLNGSRGPLLRKATAADWAGDPIEIEGRFSPRHRERTYAEMLEHVRDYTDVVGDHPLNLAARSLAFTAYALTGEPRYRDWVLEYVDAWVARTEANGGIIPSNIGLEGRSGASTAGGAAATAGASPATRCRPTASASTGPASSTAPSAPSPPPSCSPASGATCSPGGACSTWSTPPAG